jgi:hypothetical protein
MSRFSLDVKNALGCARISSQGFGAGVFSGFFSSFFSFSFSRDEDDDDLDDSFFGSTGESAAIWFQMRKKLGSAIERQTTYKRKAMVMFTHVTCMEVTPGSSLSH